RRAVADGLAARLDGRARVDRHDLGAGGHEHFGETARAAADLEHTLAVQALRPAGACEEPLARQRLAGHRVELDPAIAVPLLAEAIRVVHVAHRRKPMLYPWPS